MFPSVQSGAVCRAGASMSKRILEYGSRTPPKPGLWTATACTALITVPAHLMFSFFSAIWLEETFHNTTVGWTSIAWLPVCIARNFYSDRMVGILMLLGSSLAGVAMASMTVKCLFKIERPLGSYYWRLLLTLCLWLLWFPVPRVMAVMAYG